MKDTICGGVCLPYPKIDEEHMFRLSLLCGEPLDQLIEEEQALLHLQWAKASARIVFGVRR